MNSWSCDLPTFPARRNLIIWNVRIQADENLVVGQLTPFPNTRSRVSALKVLKVADLIWLLYERGYRFGHCYYDDSIFQCLAEWNHLAGKVISGRGTDSVCIGYNMAAVKRANRETAVRSVSDKPLDWKFSDQVNDAQLQRGLHVLANNSQSVIEYFTRQ